jgi:hypothetical protein
MLGVPYTMELALLVHLATAVVILPTLVSALVDIARAWHEGSRLGYILPLWMLTAGRDAANVG